MTYIFDIVHLLELWLVTWRPDYTVFPNGVVDAKKYVGVPWLLSRIATIYCLPLDYPELLMEFNNPGQLDSSVALHIDLLNRTDLRTMRYRTVTYKATPNTLAITFT